MVNCIGIGRIIHAAAAGAIRRGRGRRAFSAHWPWGAGAAPRRSSARRAQALVSRILPAANGGSSLPAAVARGRVHLPAAGCPAMVVHRSMRVPNQMPGQCPWVLLRSCPMPHWLTDCPGPPQLVSQSSTGGHSIGFQLEASNS